MLEQVIEVLFSYFEGTSKNSDLLRANPEVLLKGFGEGKRDEMSIIRGSLESWNRARPVDISHNLIEQLHAQASYSHLRGVF